MDSWLDRIRPITTKRAPVSIEEVDAYEAAQGPLPSGYRSFMNRFGVGTVTNWVRVYPPARIASECEAWRERIFDYWFWESDGTDMDHERALDCVCFGDTMGGDELIAHPQAPDEVYILPRNYEVVMRAGSSLEETLVWLHESGKLTAPLRSWYFEPWVERLGCRAEGTGAEHEEIVAAVQRTGLVDHREDASPEEAEEDGEVTTLLIPCVGGLMGIHDASDIMLVCDADADQDLLGKLIQALESSGCTTSELECVPAP